MRAVVLDWGSWMLTIMWWLSFPYWWGKSFKDAAALYAFNTGLIAWIGQIACLCIPVFFPLTNAVSGG